MGCLSRNWHPTCGRAARARCRCRTRTSCCLARPRTQSRQCVVRPAPGLHVSPLARPCFGGMAMASLVEVLFVPELFAPVRADALVLRRHGPPSVERSPRNNPRSTVHDRTDTAASVIQGVDAWRTARPGFRLGSSTLRMVRLRWLRRSCAISPIVGWRWRTWCYWSRRQQGLGSDRRRVPVRPERAAISDRADACHFDHVGPLATLAEARQLFCPGLAAMTLGFWRRNMIRWRSANSVCPLMVPRAGELLCQKASDAIGRH